MEFLVEQRKNYRGITPERWADLASFFGYSREGHESLFSAIFG
jgi:hypothetical protein